MKHRYLFGVLVVGLILIFSGCSEESVKPAEPVDLDRYAYRCHVADDEMLIWVGGSSECEVLDKNGNWWFVNPNNLRTLLDGCPSAISETVKNYSYYRERQWVEPRYADNWTEEELKRHACKEAR